VDSVDAVVPVDVYVAGCPPRPDEIINGVVTCLNLLKEDAAHGGKEWRQKKPATGVDAGAADCTGVS
jgi:NADH:ubiquinone oxidoreductase subunit B-like Fe-S oxidoreductase